MDYNKRLGKFGEDLAAKYLQSKGYEIMDRNVKNSYQEIDIIAKISGKIIFIEVKTKSSCALGTAEDNISRKKINNIKKAMKMYLGHDKYYDNIGQIDFLAIDLDKSNNKANIKHYKDIW